jgi:outer membrane protein
MFLLAAIYLSRGCTSGRRSSSRCWLATLLVCFAGMSGLIPRTANAQTLEQQQLEQTGLGRGPATGNWNNFLGAGVAVAPTYEGADSDRVRPVPLLLFDYRDQLFFGPLGLEWKAIDIQGFRAGPVIGLSGGRSQSLSPQLEGLGDIRTSITAGVFATYRTGPFQLATTFRQAITHTENGWLGLVQFDYRTVIVTRRVLLAVGPEVEFASSQYNQTYFGVSGVQSLDSGLPVFTPGAGLKDYGVHGNLTYVCTEHILVRTFVDVKEIAGNLTDSPIVQRSTETIVGLGVVYHFK